jgi:hypothetical protein
MEEFKCANDYWPLLPDGAYIAQCIGYDISTSFGGKSRKIYLKFKIIEGPYEGSELFMPFNYPLNGKFTPGYKYWLYWVMVHGRPPSKNAKMSPKVFKSKIFNIRTVRVKRKFPNGNDMPSDCDYSKVDTIEEVLA